MCDENPRLADSDHPDHFCFATLKKNDTTGDLTPDLKGCIVGLQDSNCSRDRCLAEPFHADTNVYHCCCTTQLCNANVEMLPAPTISPGSSVLCVCSNKCVSYYNILFLFFYYCLCNVYVCICYGVCV